MNNNNNNLFMKGNTQDFIMNPPPNNNFNFNRMPTGPNPIGFPMNINIKNINSRNRINDE
jgi:hypothetical protein